MTPTCSLTELGHSSIQLKSSMPDAERAAKLAMAPKHTTQVERAKMSKAYESSRTEDDTTVALRGKFDVAADELNKLKVQHGGQQPWPNDGEQPQQSRNQDSFQHSQLRQFLVDSFRQANNGNAGMNGIKQDFGTVNASGNSKNNFANIKNAKNVDQKFKEMNFKDSSENAFGNVENDAPVRQD